MKERNFYSDDFEQLIRDKTEQYKMYPSERVWKGIHNSLHTKRRWFIGSMSLLVTGILFFAGKELILPSPHSTTASRKLATPAIAVTETPKTWLAAHIPHPAHNAFHSANAVATAARHDNATENDLLEDQDPSFKDISITLSHPVVDPSNLSDWMNRVQLPDHAPEIAVIATRPITGDAGRMPEDVSKANARPGTETAASREIGDEGDAEGLSTRAILESLSAKGADAVRNKAGMNGRLESQSLRQRMGKGANGNGIAAEGTLEGSIANSSKASAAAIAELQDRERVNWLHDYALNSLPTPSNRGRTFFQLTLAPTVSYHSFSGDPGFGKTEPGGAFSASHVDLKNNSAAFGFEFGGSILYRLTRNLSVRGGLQFNFTRYQITAFETTDPGSPAPVLNTYSGYQADSAHRAQGQGTNQASAASGGGTPTVSVVTVNNDYYQLSAPIGFELRILGNERLQLHLAATVQPSYLLGSTAYMMDPNGMKYSKDIQRYRKWNLSTGFEAFLSYRTGSVRWQIGPEFRYQLLSTYNLPYSSYTENLRTYGIKIGITKMLP